MADDTQKIFNFILSEEQVLLQDMARQFFRDKVGTANLRKLRDSEDADGIDRDIWQEAVGLGFAGILIPEEYGGTGFGLTGMGLVMQEAGRVLAATPLLSSSIISSLLLLQAGSENQKQDILPKIADGSQLVALALEESGHHNPRLVALSCVETDGGLTLNGQKTLCLMAISLTNLLL